MTLDRFICFNKEKSVSGLFSAIGSFGVIDGSAEYESTENGNVRSYVYDDGKVRLKAEFTFYDNGVAIRRDYFENLTDGEIVLRKLSGRFRFLGNDYSVYTQFNSWQQESIGGWQKLITDVSTSSGGIWTCGRATPILALRDEYGKKSTVFHLLPNCQWKMTVRKQPVNGKYETVVLETGIDDEGLSLKVFPKETIDLPTIIFYTADKDIGYDAYKLHEVYNELYPRREMPVIYNSWLYDFGDIDVDEMFKQIDCAADLGIEAFTIDAGWFGDGDGWWEQTGDWTENLNYGPKGRLIEISRRVHEKGMKFGLWFEPERGGKNSEIVKAHPEFFFGGKFLDFASKKAREYMADKICECIEKYSLEWIKLDFNSVTPYDETGNSFYRYFQGQREFIRLIKERYPDIYIINCAGGGSRMDLMQGTFTDSFWLSDNQGSYEGIRIVKDTLKRMPSQLIERWDVQKYCEGFTVYGKKGKTGIMVNANNATWDRVINVTDDFNKAFMTGGPIGFSCDIAAFPDEYKIFWKNAIAEFKKDREFYGRATARILTDSEEIIVLEYADKEFERCIVQVYTRNSYANDLVVYPSVDADAVYCLGDKTITGKEITENGIILNGLQSEDCRVLDLKVIK